MRKPDEYKYNVSGTLKNATTVNRLDMCNLSGTQIIATVYTNSSGAWGPVALPGGQYKIKVNESCWATKPNPLTVLGNVSGVVVEAPCTAKGTEAAVDRYPSLWAYRVYLDGARGSNRLDFYQGNTLVAAAYTDKDEAGTEGFCIVSMPTGRYRCRVNGSAWAKRMGVEEYEVKSGIITVHLAAESTDLHVGPKPKPRNVVKKK